MDRNLSAFIAIAEERNLTLAARKIGLAQPSLTKKLRAIEQDYGGRLFDRHPRGMELTMLGERLYAHAKKIERDYQHAREDLEAINAGHLDVLRIGAGPAFHLLYMSTIFLTLREEFPATRLFLTTGAVWEHLPQLLRFNMELVVGRLDMADEADDLYTRKLTTVEHGVVARRGHAIGASGKLRARDLASCTWVVFGSSTEADHMLHGYFQLQDMKQPELAVHTTSFATALQLVCQGDFLMHAPVQLAPVVEAAGATMHRTEPPIHRFDAGIYARPNTRRFPIVSRFIELLESQLQQGAQHADPTSQTAP